MSKTLSALAHRYGSLQQAVAAGWQFIEANGTQVTLDKTEGPHHLTAPAGQRTGAHLRAGARGVAGRIDA